MKKNKVILDKDEFLKCVYNVYEECSISYLLALRDALSVIISKKVKIHMPYLNIKDEEYYILNKSIIYYKRDN